MLDRAAPPMIFAAAGLTIGPNLVLSGWLPHEGTIRSGVGAGLIRVTFRDASCCVGRRGRPVVPAQRSQLQRPSPVPSPPLW